MKLLSNEVDKDGSGTMKLVPEEPEDMWHTYNLLCKGDFLRATTIRKVQRESATGSTESERVRLSLTIEVTDIEFDSMASKLRVNGRNVVETDHVKVGAFHTIELELNRAFSIGKKEWDAVHLERIREATDPTVSADLAAIVMQEGLAHICLVNRSMTIVRSRIETNIPRKGQNSIFNRDKAMAKFFDSVLRAVLQYIDLTVVKVCLIASPGFVKDAFFRFMVDEASRKNHRSIIENKFKFIHAHSSSGHKQALEEVLSSPAMQTRLQDTRAVAESGALQAFFDTLTSDPDRAVYGPGHVFYADSMCAIQTLLLTDQLFRDVDVGKRKKHVTLVEHVRASGGIVHILSSLHTTGEQLASMTGIAALLRFPLPDLDEFDFEDEGFDPAENTGE
mmetsp:Transcript_17278/g.35885  ORF Transcript_17278/g.35885 Transcript_17278/m.35885 type:complete len:392 (-) Transcript_17278:561-1736(-)